MRWFYAFLLLAFPIGSASQAQDVLSESAAMKIPIFRIVTLVGRLGWNYPEPYYGTSIQFSIDKRYVYLVANYHCLPHDRSRWNQLFVTTPSERVGQADKLKVEVIGVWPGYDIAVLRVDFVKAGVGEIPNPSSWQKWMDAHFWNVPITGKSWRLAILGTSNETDGNLPTMTRFLWKEEAKLLSSRQGELINKDWNNRTLIAQWRASDTLQLLNYSSDCNPSFFSQCFKVPMRTGGYSGGAFLVAPPENANDVKIAGIVWGYSPLARLTYILPWPKVHEVASELVRRFKKPGNSQLVEVLDDENHQFSFAGANAIRIETTSELFTKTISRRNLGDNVVFGGGESSGGGGESSGGGGESSGGGGESSGGGGGESSHAKNLLPFVMESAEHDVAGVWDSASLLAEIKAPDRWSRWLPHIDRLTQSLEPFRGTRALLSYQPGVVIENERYQRFNEIPLINLSAFVNAFRANPQGKLERDFIKNEFPRKLSLEGNGDEGSYGLFMASLLHTVVPAKVSSILKTPPLRSLFLKEEVAAMERYLSIKGKAPFEAPEPFLYRRSKTSLAASLFQARVIIDSNGFHIEITAPRFAELGSGPIVYDASMPLVQQGDYFLRYAGPLTYTPPAIYPRAKGHGPTSTTVSAVVSLQYDPDEKRYELKLFAIGKQPPEWDELSNFYPELSSLAQLLDPQGTVMMQSVFVPLR